MLKRPINSSLNLLKNVNYQAKPNSLSLRYAKQLLDVGGNGNSGVPAGHRVLARLYAGEALILLDRISEAVAYLDPHKVSS